MLINALPGETPPETTEAPETAASEEGEPSETAEETETSAETETPEETAEASAEEPPAEVPEALKTYAEDIRKQTEADTLLVINTTGKIAWIAGDGADALPGIQAALSGGDAYTAAAALFTGSDNS